MSDVIAYVLVPGNKKGERIGLVRFGESGYYPTEYDQDDFPAAAIAHLNVRLGVPADVAVSMFYGSMFGWHVPGAAPARLYAEGLNDGR